MNEPADLHIDIEDAQNMGYDVHPHYPDPETEGTATGRRYEYITPDGQTSVDSFETEAQAWGAVLKLLNAAD